MKARYLSSIDEAGKVKEDVLSSNELGRKAFIGPYKPILALRTKKFSIGGIPLKAALIKGLDHEIEFNFF